MNKKELRLYLAIAKAEEAAIYRRLSQYRGTIGGARNLLRMSAYKGHVRTLLEMELDKYGDKGTALKRGPGVCGFTIHLAPGGESHIERIRDRVRGDVIV